jgi:hypothetical protein
MATEDLQINIGANTQDLQNGLNQASQSVQNFGTQLSKAIKPTGDATNALTNLSRVAQDAPYGFMGIANNLNPLLESFQRLSKETGSAGDALKSMVGGLMGPAGLGLALGVISSLIVTYGSKIGDLLTSTSDLEKSQRELRASFVDSLKGVETTIINDQALVAVINDVTMSTQAREAALKQLKEAHKGNVELQKTDINDGEKLIAVIDRMSQALIRKAQIEATAKIIGEKQAEIVRLQTASLEEQIGDLSAWSKGWDFVSGSMKGLTNNMGGVNIATTLTGNAIENNGIKASKTQKVIDSLKNSLLELTKASFGAGDYNVTGTSAPKAVGGGGGGASSSNNNVDTSRLDTLKKLQQLYKDDPYLFKENADKIAEETQRINKLKVKSGKDAANQLTEIDNQYAIDKLLNQKELGDKLTKMFAAEDKEWLRGQKEANKKAEEEESKADKLRIEAEKAKQKQLQELQKQQEQFANAVASNVTNGLFAMYDAIQKGESPLQALSDMLGQIVRQFIQAVIQATIFKGIMALLNAATGGGSGFLGSVGKLLGMAEGGIVSRPTLAMVGEGGQSEAVMPLNKLGNMMNSTFNAGAMSGTGGGGNGQFVLKGNDLVLALQRSNYSLNLRRGA